MIYELRIYTILPGRIDAIRERFSAHTLGIFARLGMQVCDFWEDLEAEPKLYYTMKYESMEERTRQWEIFSQDKEWNEVKQRSELDGKIVERIEQIFMKRAEYFNL
ncbi:NIPSNAP family protein [Paenibacillus alginolyticus]|uniref:NIPSNAP family protein n=1 Tax=Paenibacillus alginolyticus TaxID=59839 RepID=A0ABT4G5Y4_9BACL|nr:NIPSNAP family protein [Paenibacillus alginolyticus]MCY9668576.1 NIPSNAP family protein [Paenibacillus alginolyticus]MCY9691591.1 NIPSNAP family protein [Paenibacillus alginolyticus]MEC0146973.1 NIPSNAP family protein [Paenibacillus alginolyticus]